MRGKSIVDIDKDKQKKKQIFFLENKNATLPKMFSKFSQFFSIINTDWIGLYCYKNKISLPNNNPIIFSLRVFIKFSIFL